MKRESIVFGLLLLFFWLAWMSDSFVVKLLFYLEMLFLFICSRIFKTNDANCGEFRSVTSGRVGAYVINLDGAKDRWNFVEPSVTALGFAVERVSAIDGKTLSPKEIESVASAELYKFFFKMYPEEGTIGCALSHEKAWRTFLESDNEFAIIFEDDVQFDPKKLREVIEFALKEKDLWNIVNFETKHDGFPQRISKYFQEQSLVVYLTNVTHAGCYLIDRRAAYELLRKFYPIKMPIDHYFTAAWEFDLKFVGVEPRIVFQKFGDSHIKTSPAKKIRILFVIIANAIYLVQRAVLHFAYNFLCLSYFRQRRT
ncbi:MAG: glycosyltransferase family 25 protein [Holosporaceae bacterium]|jgi:GR25 family glycosyltransferase involved in LPS biosynthesis|nr:glycosyltransferase family 25 protein [Holosporaceae bacterium]